ncbi:hypothetical protein [Cognatilysobacter lacus]|nr:hypothetical protein [Lysobacter lacus]
MRKLIPLMVAVSILAFLPGCGDNDTTPPSVAKGGSEEATSTAAAPAAPATEQPVPVAISSWTPPASEVPNIDLCSLDDVSGQPAVNGAYRATAGQGITFEGWATTPEMKQIPNISIILDGPTDFQVSGPTGIYRADVQKVYGVAAAKAGFRIELPTLEVPPGEYQVNIAPNGQASFMCTTHFKLVVS